MEGKDALLIDDVVFERRRLLLAFYFEDALPANTKWYKYDSIDEALIDVTSSISISGNSVTLTLTDGSIGDMDGVINGVIIDPSGPAFSSSPTPTPSPSPTPTPTPTPTTLDDDGGGGGGSGVFGIVSLNNVIGYHFDWSNKDGIAVYMPVTKPFKALKGAQTHVEGFAPGLADFIRGRFDVLERKAKKNPDGSLSKIGTDLFPTLGKIAELYLEIVGEEELSENAYSKTTISIEEYNRLHREGKAISSHIVKVDSE